MSGLGTSFYVTGGTLRHDAPSYVARQADHELLEGLRQGEFCYVLTARQMGKSSLMVRAAAKLRAEGTHVVVLDLTAIGQNVTPEQWYDGLLVRIGRQLGLEDELEEHWQNHPLLSPVQRLFATIRDVALVRRPGAHVIFVDEIDMVRSLPFSTDEFFAAIRECYNRRTEDVELGRLSFCLLGVATPSDLVRDTRITPFNIGRRIELRDFLPDEAQPLTQGLVISATGALPAQEVLTRMLYWTDGHPFLTQRLCLAAVEVNGQAGKKLRSAADVDLLCHDLFFGERARERDDNLLFVSGRLLRADVDRPGLLHLYDSVLRGQTVLDDERDPLVSVLRLAGIVRAEGGLLVRRNRIYQTVFDRAWVRAQMPGAELARQKAAFRRGVKRTTAIAAVVVVVLFIAALVALQQAAQARRALAFSYFSQAQFIRKSASAGQREGSLLFLEMARTNYPNTAALRDEALASLALVDLKPITNSVARLPTNTLVELSADLQISAEARSGGGGIVVRRYRDGQELASLPGSDSNCDVGRLQFSPDASMLAAEYHGMSQARLVVWNWQARRKLFEIPYVNSDRVFAFGADSQELAVSLPDGMVGVFTLPEGKLEYALKMTLDSQEPRPPLALRLHPSGSLLAVSSTDDQYVELWSPGAERPTARLHHAGLVNDLAWHPNGHLLAAACDDSKVYLWQTNNSRNPRKLAGHEGQVKAVNFNPQGTLLASVSADEMVRLWVPTTERQVSGDLGPESFDRLIFSVDGRHLIASGSDPSRTRLWEVRGGELIVLQAGAEGGVDVRSIDFSPDSRWLLAASGRRITIWETSAGEELASIPLPNALAAGFAADSESVVASNDRGIFKWNLFSDESANRRRLGAGETLKLHRVPTNAPRLEWVPETNVRPGYRPVKEVGMMAMSPDRTTAAVVHMNDVFLLPLEPEDDDSGLRTLHLNAYHPLIALHPRAEWLASRTGDADVLHLWNLAADEEDFTSLSMKGTSYFTFSPNGRWLATCWTGEFRFYRVGEWEEPAIVVRRPMASDQHAPMAFAWDGSTVALTTSRYTIELHRLPASGRGDTQLIAKLESPDRLPLQMLAFSPDSRHLAAATDGSIVLLWNLAALDNGLAKLDLRGNWPKAP